MAKTIDPAEADIDELRVFAAAVAEQTRRPVPHGPDSPRGLNPAAPGIRRNAGPNDEREKPDTRVGRSRAYGGGEPVGC